MGTIEQDKTDLLRLFARAEQLGEVVHLIDAAEMLVRRIEDDAAEQQDLERYRCTARAIWQKDGEIEVDDDAVVSISENPGDNGENDGAYVAAWVFVYDGDVFSGKHPCRCDEPHKDKPEDNAGVQGLPEALTQLAEANRRTPSCRYCNASVGTATGMVSGEVVELNMCDDCCDLMEDWREDVEKGDTVLGFVEWCKHNLAPSPIKVKPMSLNKKQTATVLAALRYWQREGWRSSGHEIEIACDGDAEPLENDEIDTLCEQINCNDDPIRNLLERAVQRWKRAMDNEDEGIPGTEAVDWLTEFYEEAQAALEGK